MADRETRCRVCGGLGYLSENLLRHEHWPAIHMIPTSGHHFEPEGIDDATLALWREWLERDREEQAFVRAEHRAEMAEIDRVQRAQARAERSFAYHRYLEKTGGGEQ